MKSELVSHLPSLLSNSEAHRTPSLGAWRDLAHVRSGEQLRNTVWRCSSFPLFCFPQAPPSVSKQDLRPPWAVSLGSLASQLI